MKEKETKRKSRNKEMKTLSKKQRFLCFCCFYVLVFGLLLGIEGGVKYLFSFTRKRVNFNQEIMSRFERRSGKEEKNEEGLKECVQ